MSCRLRPIRFSPGESHENASSLSLAKNPYVAGSSLYRPTYSFLGWYLLTQAAIRFLPVKILLRSDTRMALKSR